MDKERKENFKIIQIATINNTTSRKQKCSCFKFLYSDKKKNKKSLRCLLNEYTDDIGSKEEKAILTQKDASKICKYFDPSIKTKCKYPFNFTKDEEIEGYEETLRESREKIIKYEEEIMENRKKLEELKSLNFIDYFINRYRFKHQNA